MATVCSAKATALTNTSLASALASRIIIKRRLETTLLNGASSLGPASAFSVAGGAFFSKRALPAVCPALAARLPRLALKRRRRCRHSAEQLSTLLGPVRKRFRDMRASLALFSICDTLIAYRHGAATADMAFAMPFPCPAPAPPCAIWLLAMAG